MTAVAWVLLALIVLAALGLAWAVWDVPRHPGRWFTGPSLDDRERERRGQS